MFEHSKVICAFERRGPTIIPCAWNEINLELWIAPASRAQRGERRRCGQRHLSGKRSLSSKCENSQTQLLNRDVESSDVRSVRHEDQQRLGLVYKTVLRYFGFV